MAADTITTGLSEQAAFEQNIRKLLEETKPGDLSVIIAQCMQRGDRIDAHLQANMAFQLLSLLEGNVMIAEARGLPITKESVSQTFNEFVASYQHNNPVAGRVAGTIAQHLNQKYVLGLSLQGAAPSLFDDRIFNRLARYADIADRRAIIENTPIFGAFELRHHLLNNPDILRVVQSIPETGSLAAGLPYRMNPEERDVLTRELLNMNEAAKFAVEGQKVPKDRKDLKPYRSSRNGYTSADISTAYKYMIGMGGSEGYRKAVNAIFGHLIESAIQFEQAPHMALIGSPFKHDDVHVAQSMLRMRESLLSHGAHPVVIDVAKPPKSYDAFDGIVLTGNDWDIDPSDYSDPKHPILANPHTKSEMKRENYASDADHTLGLARREQEMAAIKTAFEHRIPLFGVCGGMQRINVIKGGTLKQHVEGGHQGNSAPHTPTRCVQVLENSKLAFLANGQHTAYVPTFADNTGPLTLQQAEKNINSYHHQVLDTIGDGLVRNAAAALIDKPNEITLMGLESRRPDKHFVLGVQWHPEFMPNAQLSKNILDGVVNAAKSHAKNKGGMAAVGDKSATLLGETPGEGSIIKH